MGNEDKLRLKFAVVIVFFNPFNSQMKFVFLHILITYLVDIVLIL